MAHPPEPEHGTEHAHDDHGHGHDDHGHGHGHGTPPAFPIIPENSGADKLLICLAFFALAGWLTFATIMLSAKPHHGEDASPSHTEAPAGTHAGDAHNSGATPEHAGSSTDHGKQAPEEHH